MRDKITTNSNWNHNIQRLHHGHHLCSELYNKRQLKFLLLSILSISSLCHNCEGNPSSQTATRTNASARMNDSLRQQTQHLESLPKIAPLLGEAAIIDKESGRVYWQGGEQSLFHSTVGHTYFRNTSGLARHVRSTCYSFILWISVVRYLTRKILSNMDSFLHYLEASSSIRMTQRIRSVAKYSTRVLRVFVICLACLPQFGRNFLIFIGVCYFIESYTCSTRKYLDNVMTTEDVETYLVSWKLHSYELSILHFSITRLVDLNLDLFRNYRKL